MAAQDDPALLKELVQRLNSELARKMGVAGSSAESEWMLSSDELPPLIMAYDHRIAELEHSEAEYRSLAESAAAELTQVNESNTALRSELAKALETTIRQEKLATRGIGRAVDTATEVKELRERLEVLYQENEVLTEQQAEMNDELDRMRQEKIHQAHEHMALVRAIGTLRDELAAATARERRATEGRDRAHAELQKCAAELLQSQEYTQQAMSISERHAAERDLALASVAEYSAQLDRLRAGIADQRADLLDELAAAHAAEREMQARLEKLEVAFADLAQREQAAVDHLSAARADALSGTEALRALENRCIAAERKVEELTNELAGERKRAKEAEERRREAKERVEALQEELERKERSMSALAAEEKNRRDELTASLRQEGRGKLVALQDELRAMELTLADLNYQLQRSQRDRAGGGRREPPSVVGSMSGLALGLTPWLAESSLPISSLLQSESISRAARMEGTRAMDELATRLGVAERERDAAEHQKRELTMQLRVLKETTSQERTAAAAREEKLQRQLRRLDEESVSCQLERKRLVETNQRLELSSAQMSAEMSALKYQHAEESRMVREERDATVSSLQNQLADARTLHDQSSSELEELLKAQEEMGARYRSEAKTIAERSEALVQELRAELERLTVRNAELTTQLSSAIGRVGQLSVSERDEAVKAQSLEAQLRNLQAERLQLNSQLLQLRAAEKGWLAERKAFVKQLQSSRVALSSTGGPAVQPPPTGSSGMPSGATPKAANAATVSPVGRHATGGSYSKDVKSLATEELEAALAEARIRAKTQQLVMS